MKNNGTTPVLTIDKNIPIPELNTGPWKRGRFSKYPFRAMKPGDSFFLSGTTTSKFSANTSQFKKLNPKFNFTVRAWIEKKIPGVRCWRIKPVKKAAIKA